MLIIQQRKSSIYRTVLLIVLFQLTFVDKSISNQGICGSSNTRRISYFEVGNQEVNWNEAWRLCKDKSSTLPVICNQQEQDSFTNYLKANITSSAAWIAGRMIEFNEWKWVDGQPFKRRTSAIEVPHVSFSHVLLEQFRKYKAYNPSHIEVYLCQYAGSSCNSENVINVTIGCVRPSDDTRKWYDARNQCVKNGGDLAILNDDDLVTLRRSNKVNAEWTYWIGLRKNAWHWMWQATVPLDDSDEEIKYSNWSSGTHHRSYECISIDAWNGEWKAVPCTDRKKVVCQRNFGSDETTSGTSSIMTSTMSSTIVGLSNTTPAMSSLSECAVQCTTNVPLMTVVIVGLCVIVISNIIISLVVRKYYLRRANTSSNTEATETKCYQDLETTRRQANPDGTYTELQLQPVYEEVSKRGR